VIADVVCTQELERGSIVNFVLGSPVSLGDLAYLRIWHDNSGSGKKKGWYLDRIDITDLNTGEK
jgi:polycystin 1L2